jgi:CDP-diacylglycerol--glycerol-3-phosphate 3-phosphatidyltransferase
MRISSNPEPVMSAEKSYLAPNLVIASRVALAFVAVALFRVASPGLAWVAVVLTVVIIAMDGLDGYLARRLDLASELGGVLDITADRIVEHVYWISFAVFGLVGLWVPLVVMTRSFLVDTIRGMALARGKTAFGSSTMQTSAVARFLTGGRLVRTLYGVAKVAAFVLLGIVLAVERANAIGSPSLTPESFATIQTAARISVWIAVALCVVRGVPVLLDGRTYPTGGDAPEESVA